MPVIPASGIAASLITVAWAPARSGPLTAAPGASGVASIEATEIARSAVLGPPTV